MQYGDLSGIVYAVDEEEARDIAEDSFNIHEESYDDSDDSGDSSYDYSEMTIELEESDIPNSEIPARQTPITYSDPESRQLPSHFLEDLPVIATIR